MHIQKNRGSLTARNNKVNIKKGVIVDETNNYPTPVRKSFSVSNYSHLQKVHSRLTNLNALLRREISPNLAIGHAGDKYEQEANKVAEQVMSLKIPTVSSGISPKQSIYIKNRNRNSEDRNLINEKEPIHYRSKKVSSHFPQVIQNASNHKFGFRDSGQPLSESSRAFFEPRLGYDLRKVRLHNNKGTTISANTLCADAYTIGNHIVVGKRHFSQDSTSGRKLLAHELTHTIQQSQTANRLNLHQRNQGKHKEFPPKKSVHVKNATTVPMLQRRCRVRRQAFNPRDIARRLYRCLHRPNRTDRIDAVSDFLRLRGRQYLQVMDAYYQVFGGNSFDVLVDLVQQQLDQVWADGVRERLVAVQAQHTEEVAHEAREEIPEQPRVRPPRDTEALSRHITRIIIRHGVTISPGQTVNILLAVLERQHLTPEETLDVFQRLETSILRQVLSLVQVTRFREFLHDAQVPWDFIFENWEPSINDTGAVFAGFVLGVGENFIDAIRLIAVITGSPWSERLASERDQFYTAIRQLFAHPVVLVQQGISTLYNTFTDHLWNLRFFQAGRILGHVVITLLTLPSAFRAIPSAARAIASAMARLTVFTVRMVRELGVRLRSLVEIALRPRPYLVTPEGMVLMAAGDDILIIGESSQPLGRIPRNVVFQEARQSAAAGSQSGQHNPFYGLAESEIDEFLRRWELELESQTRSVQPHGRAAPIPPISIGALENIVSAAIHNIRGRLGSRWLPARHFGTRLHSEVERLITSQFGSTSGWLIAAERSIDDLASIVPTRIRSMSIRQFLSETPTLAVYQDELSRIFRSLDQRIGNLRPDLVIRGPSETIVWDLTARITTNHLAKTLFYAHVLRDGSRIARIGETYWRHFAAGFRPGPGAFYFPTSVAGQISSSASESATP